MWIIVLELWAVTEEQIQFNADRAYKHDVFHEFSIYQSFSELYLDKINQIAKSVEERKQVAELEDDLTKIAQKPEVLSKMKDQILGVPTIPKPNP